MSEDELLQYRRRADDERLHDRRRFDEMFALVVATDERVRQHIEDSKERHQQIEKLNVRVDTLEKVTGEVCAICTVGRKVLWLVGTGGVIVVWWWLQRYLERQGL